MKDEPTSTPYLLYVGNAHLPGVPARNLSREEVAELPVNEEALLASGLYVLAKPKGKPGPSENKIPPGPAESKGA
jgi:hypothetical protein